MKREYPLILIDRSKSESYPNDFVMCFDSKVGFVAKIFFLPKNDSFRLLVEKMQQVENCDIAGVCYPLKKGGVVMQIVDFLHYFELTKETRGRIQSLLKRAMKKYLYAEMGRNPNRKDLDIDNQIAQQELSIERAIQNRSDLVARAGGNEEIADYQIDLARETLNSLKRLREMKHFFESGIDLSFYEKPTN